MIGINTMQLADSKAWSVGYWMVYDRGPTWIEICQFSKTIDAVNRVNMLNGGPGIVDEHGVAVLFAEGVTTL